MSRAIRSCANPVSPGRTTSRCQYCGISSQSCSKNTGRIGRGPTSDMSPCTTFHSCGSSSRCIVRSQRAHARELVARPLVERRRLVRAEPDLGVAAERAQLVHREHLARAPDPQPAVEDRAAGRQEDQQHERADERRGQPEQRPGDHDVEGAQERVERAVLVGMVRLGGPALGDRLRALELLGAAPLRGVRGLRGRRGRPRPQHHAAPRTRSTSSCGSRRSTRAGPSRLTSSIARGSVSGRSRPSRISASSTPPRRPP